MTTTKTGDHLMTIHELQKRLGGIGRSKAYDLVRTGQIPSYRIGRILRVRLQDIETWLEENRYHPHTVNNPDENQRRPSC